MVSSCRHLMLGLKSSLVLISRKCSIRSATRKRNRVANLPRKPKLNEQAGHVARKRCNQTINVLLRANHRNTMNHFCSSPVQECRDRYLPATVGGARTGGRPPIHLRRDITATGLTLPRCVPLCLIIKR